MPYPVYHILTVMTVDAHATAHASRAVFHTTLKGSQFFGLQVLVGLMTAYGVVEFRHTGHTQRCVIRGIHLPVVADAITGIDARVHAHIHLVP